MHGPVRLSPGAVFAQDFEIIAQLAEGGMGTVYAVRERGQAEERALKVLLPELVTEESTRRRFEQEAQIASQIESEHVPRIYRAGIDQASGVPWISMELLRGRDLRRHVKAHGPLSVADAEPVLMQLGDALRAAHARGLVHRDLKPENVFLADMAGGGFHVKLLDFGVAKVIDLHRTSALGTGAIGSPLWMAPEQTAKGGRIAPATDVFAYALVVFYTLSGTFYWKAAHDTAGVGGLLRELYVDEPVAPSVRARELGRPAPYWPELDEWFMRATAKEGQERFREGGEALEALRVAFARRRDHSMVAFASTMQVERSVAVPMVLPSKEELDARRDTSPGISLDPSAIPPTDPPDPMPVQPPMPAMPGPAPLPGYAAPPQGRSMIFWVFALLVVGIATACLSGIVMWIVLSLVTID